MNEPWANIRKVEGGYIVETDAGTSIYISLQKAISAVKAAVSEKDESENP